MRVRRSALGWTVGFAVLLSGCSDAAPSWTYGGQEVTSASESVAQLDAIWAQTLAESPVPISSTKADCFYQVTSDVVAETAVCGPFRVLGDDADYWVGVPLVAEQVNGGVLLVAQPDVAAATPLPGAELLRPDGTTGDPSLQADPVVAPAAAPGDVVALEENQLDDAPVVDISQPDQLLQVQIGTLEEAGSDLETVGPPSTGLLVGIRIVEQTPIDHIDDLPSALTDPDAFTELTIQAGSEEYALSIDDLSDGGQAVAVDGTEPILVSAMGERVITVDISSGEHREGDAPFEIAGVERLATETSVDNDGGFEFLYASWWTASAIVDGTVGEPAPEGRDWLVLEGEHQQDSVRWDEGSAFNIHYRDVEMRVTSLTVIVDGEEIEVEVADLDIETSHNSLSYSGVVPVPEGVGTVGYQMTVQYEGDFSRSSHDEAPDRMSTTRDFESGELEVSPA